MKKALALLLALVMCLSLAACGEKTQTVEITMDNWQDFFEIRYETLWHKDDFGDIVALTYQCYFAVRPEYVEKIILEDSELIIGETCVTAYRTYNVSWENQTFSLGDYNTYYDVENLHRENFTQTLANTHLEDLVAGNLFLFGGADLSKGDTFCLPDENGEDQKVVHYYVCTLNKIKGSIVIKGELLDLPEPTGDVFEPLPTNRETIPAETVPEETEATEPEPVYETIELTADNWLDYFEVLIYPSFVDCNAFDEIQRIQFETYLYIRDEYEGKYSCDEIAIEFNYSLYEHEVTVDWDNSEPGNIVYTVGERLSSPNNDNPEVKHRTDSYRISDDNGRYVYDSLLVGQANFVTNAISAGEESAIIYCVDDIDIIRIQGTITIQTN